MNLIFRMFKVRLINTFVAAPDMVGREEVAWVEVAWEASELDIPARRQRFSYLLNTARRLCAIERQGFSVSLNHSRWPQAPDESFLPPGI